MLIGVDAERSRTRKRAGRVAVSGGVTAPRSPIVCVITPRLLEVNIWKQPRKIRTTVRSSPYLTSAPTSPHRICLPKTWERHGTSGTKV